MAEADDLEKSWLLLADIYCQGGKFDLASELLRRCVQYNKVRGPPPSGWRGGSQGYQGGPVGACGLWKQMSGRNKMRRDGWRGSPWTTEQDESAKQGKRRPRGGLQP